VFHHPSSPQFLQSRRFDETNHFPIPDYLSVPLAFPVDDPLSVCSIVFLIASRLPPILFQLGLLIYLFILSFVKMFADFSIRCNQYFTTRARFSDERLVTSLFFTFPIWPILTLRQICYSSQLASALKTMNWLLTFIHSSQGLQLPLSINCQDELESLFDHLN
jgi:hypothetical protein